MSDIPRRNRMAEWIPAEHAIFHAVDVVEKTGCHPLLTEAINLLHEAQNKVADYVEGK
jgi:hypothetical protein